ncbi:phosphonate metabolism protein/1,5-bisphosphokinase (PRPP-forming) PhnN [Pseudomonas sp. KHPS1]|uniref:phosphonate metabolism protein/1,5-bisphosphokinase (PRPP-forming) PhnN n=1 Tax=Ectopseudomonas hydrolytica TaxID=2493633 RepID=UPI000BC2E018|nr:phosphonate metabolism protein/1,5-bisphosphokinase (PRPP-forming) PhnN [Pseudomonas sp. KHPS1]ATH82884.1 phosphonate metabolism protein/1,5-bisphosphokinase (PRPP-forming) PhnN [Pseudomonas mendocina]UTH38159.1 phosphonate metabolism protein/1,5-bisphosphokinase (PRPP-forming) PhnN [Pseudomonas sp. KHPS1]
MQGRLIYLMGPSGSGKDSLLQAARAPLEAYGCRFARRVITRSAESVGEDALGVTPAEFERLEGEGAFALSWRANGLAYGIPREIDDWLSAGQDVLINGSRGHLEVARQRYPQLLAILLQVDEAVLRQRLLARGRETPEQIEQRLARSRELQAGVASSPLPLAGEGPGERAGQADTVILDNSGPLQQTVSRLLHLLEEMRRCA